MNEREVNYHIKEEFGCVQGKKGWDLEVNLISWDGKPAKIDIRRWNESRDKMSKGLALNIEEAEKLLPLLKEAIVKMKAADKAE